MDGVSMITPQRGILAFLAFSALFAGAYFALPSPQKNFIKVEIKNQALLVERAADPTARVVGLSGRDSIPEFGGMLLDFGEPGLYSIWMKGMRFPIDIFWIRNGRVADLAEEVKPPAANTSESSLPIYTPQVPAEYVLETRAGFAQKYGIRIGDEVKIFLSGGVPISGSIPSGAEAHTPPPPGYEYFIETLRNTPLNGRNFRIEKLLESNSAYKKYLISYESDGIKVSGTLNLPEDLKPETGYPLLILNHGLITPSIYYPGRGSRREQDFFARNGYATLHPDYRGYGPYGEDEACPPTLSYTPQGCRHDFYAGYTRDVLNAVDALKRVNTDLLDLKRLGMWGHSMGGGISARAAVLAPEIRAYVLFAPISADVEDNFYELPSSELSLLAERYGTGRVSREPYDQMSPLSFLGEVGAPIQLHHGTADREVPLEFSQDMHSALKSYGKKSELYLYQGEGHEFGESWIVAASRALRFFDKYVR